MCYDPREPVKTARRRFNPDEEPPAKKSKVGEGEPEKQIPEELRKEMETFWKRVKDDPTDFPGWTKFLQFVDGKNNLMAGEEVFNAFLKRYPYCYGYWKKFADFQKRNGTPERVMEIFEQVFYFLIFHNIRKTITDSQIFAMLLQSLYFQSLKLSVKYRAIGRM